MRIAVLGAGHIGLAVGRLWHEAGHEITFAARELDRTEVLAAELGPRVRAATVQDAVAGNDVILVALPGPAVVDVLHTAGSLEGKVVVDAANMIGGGELNLETLSKLFPAAHWVRAFNTLQARVLAEEHDRQPSWVLLYSGSEIPAKDVVRTLIEDAGFTPLDLGGLEDSHLQDPGSPLWNNPLTTDAATALLAELRERERTR